MNPIENQITIRYYTDIITEESMQGRTDFSLSLPIPTPMGQDLINFISSRAPLAFLEERELILATPINLDHISVLLNSELSPTIVQPLTVTEILKNDQAAQVIIITMASESDMQKPVQYMGTTFQGDNFSYFKLTTAVSNGGVPYWQDINNVQVVMTLVELQGLAAIMLNVRQNAFTKLQLLKEQIRIAITSAEVVTVVW
jgi:hypothetical protein